MTLLKCKYQKKNEHLNLSNPVIIISAVIQRKKTQQKYTPKNLAANRNTMPRQKQYMFN